MGELRDRAEIGMEIDVNIAGDRGRLREIAGDRGRCLGARAEVLLPLHDDICSRDFVGTSDDNLRTLSVTPLFWWCHQYLVAV